MESTAQPPTGCMRRTFRHDSLEHSKPSIRLVRLSPDLSPDGMIQCDIFHDTIEASYTCLSYRWGVSDPSSSILINGQMFTVRQNLLNFLDMARQHEAATMIYWIDALCIDQMNVLERNHQVAQMGDIYSRATCVYLWMGATKADRDITQALRALRDPESASLQQWGLVSAMKQDLEDYICRNPYWERAWIVQEIFLARNVLVWLDTESVLFEYLHWAIDYFYLRWKGLPIARFRLSKRDIVDPKDLISNFEVAKQLYHGTSLQSLLGHFSGMKCEHARDHVFSLLSLSNEGHQFPVDYGSSDRTFFIEALKHCCASSCLCMPRILGTDVGLYDNFSNLKNQNEENEPYVKITLPILEFSDGFDVCHVDGTCFIIKTLSIQAFHFDGSGFCKSLNDILERSVWPGLMTDVNGDIQAGSGHREFSGSIEAPSGHTLSSYMQEHGSMWVTVSTGSTVQPASGVIFPEVDIETSSFYIQLSAVSNGEGRNAPAGSFYRAGLLTRNILRLDMKDCVIGRDCVKWQVCMRRPKHSSSLVGRLHTPRFNTHLFSQVTRSQG